MFRFKNKKGQNTAEYAILIALVIGGVISMQTYIQRGFQGRMRDATVYLRDETTTIGHTLQFEPGYTNQSTDIDRESYALDTANEVSRNEIRTRLKDGFRQRTEYNTGGVEGITGVGRGQGL